MRLRIIGVAAILLVIGTGVVHGRWTNRWRNSAALEAAAARIESLPDRMGEWTAVDLPFSDSDRKASGAVGCSSRRYQRDGDAAVVTVLLLCGLPSAMGAHTPDACYPGGGFTLKPTPPLTVRRREDETALAHFQAADAVRGGASPLAIQILWSWNDGEGWKAPEEPRWVFAAAPALTKLYVIQESNGSESDAETRGQVMEFLDDLLPMLDQHVFAATTNQPAP